MESWEPPTSAGPDRELRDTENEIIGGCVLTEATLETVAPTGPASVEAATIVTRPVVPAGEMASPCSPRTSWSSSSRGTGLWEIDHERMVPLEHTAPGRATG